MATSTVNTENRILNATLIDSATRGVVAGLVGGSIFGVQMATGGMLPMVAQMIGSESVLVGFILHMIISAVIGVSYAVVASRFARNWPLVVGAGIVTGIVWWVLGALIIMPLVLGMGEMVLVVQDMQIMSLVGHIIFGIVTAAFYTLTGHNS